MKKENEKQNESKTKKNKIDKKEKNWKKINGNLRDKENRTRCVRDGKRAHTTVQRSIT